MMSNRAFKSRCISGTCEKKFDSGLMILFTFYKRWVIKQTFQLLVMDTWHDFDKTTFARYYLKL